MTRTAEPSPSGVMIGLEMHAYVATQAKMFCACPNRFWAKDAEPNTVLCPVCTSQPGAKPMAPNARALEQGVRLASILGCTIQEAPVRFLRKHYFYPDLPSNYQRTSEPFARGGEVLGVRIREIHWEEDPGAYDPKLGTVDFNRSGAPLLELVTEPDIRSPAHARQVLEELRIALDYLGAMSPAGTKADANISLQGGARVEVKNLNSARNVEMALQHEAQRQADVLANGGAVVRETRHFDETFARTEPLRAKESEEDYRHLPDPDLGAIPVGDVLRAVRDTMPPRPFALRAEWVRDLGVTAEAANVLLAEPGLAACFLALKAHGARDAFDFLVGDLKRELNYRSLTFQSSGLQPADLVPLVEGQAGGELPRLRAVALLRTRLDQGAEAFRAAWEAERAAAPSVDALGPAVQEAIAANLKAVEDYRKGRKEAANRIIGEALRRLQGRADPAKVREAVLAALEAGP